MRVVTEKPGLKKARKKGEKKNLPVGGMGRKFWDKSREITSFFQKKKKEKSTNPPIDRCNRSKGSVCQGLWGGPTVSPGGNEVGYLGQGGEKGGGFFV